MSIGDRIGEACRSDIIGGRHEADRLCVRVIADRSVARIADARHGQRKTVRIRIVGEQRRSLDRQRRVFGRDQAADIVRDRRLHCRLIEDDVNPVIAGIEAAGREGGAASIGVDTIAAARSAGWSGERSIGDSIGEIIGVDRIFSAAGVVGSDISRSRSDGYRAREIDLLPAARALIAEGGAGKQGSGRTPQVRHMRTGVLRTFVEADSGDRAVRGGDELDTEGHRTGIVGRDRAWRGTRTEQCLCRRRVADRECDVTRGRGLSIGDRVSETGRSDIAGGRHEADGLGVRIVADRAVARVADTRDRQ